MRRAVALVLVLAVVVGGWWVLSRMPAGAQNQGQWIEYTVERGTISLEVAASGVVEPERTTSLSFKVPGRVLDVAVSEGDTVAEGELLASLDTAEIELQLRQAEAALAVAEAQLEKATSGPATEDVEAARAAVAAAVAGYERLRQGAVPEQLAIAETQIRKAEIALQQAQAAYDEVKWVGAVAALPQSLALQAATLDYEAARANYELQVRGAEDSDLKNMLAQIAQARAQLARLERGPEEADLAVLQAQVEQAAIGVESAQLQLGNARILAPYAGTVARVMVQEGQIAGAGVPAITVVDPASFHVTMKVDEADIGRVSAGQGATVRPESFPDLVLEGHVATVGAAPAAPEAGSTSVLGGGGFVQYPVRIDIDERLTGLRSGMTAQVVVEVSRREDTLVVPNRGVQVDRTQGITYVEKLVSGEVVPVEVMLGAPGEGVTEILAGLEEGDTIIIRSSSVRDELRRTFSFPGQDEGE